MTATATPASLNILDPTAMLAKVAAAAQAGVTSSIISFLNDLDADALGFVGQEAQDFDTLLTQFVEGVEAGKGYAAAWSTAFANFAATEKTQLWADWTNVLSQASSIFDGWVENFEAAL